MTGRDNDSWLLRNLRGGHQQQGLHDFNQHFRILLETEDLKPGTSECLHLQYMLFQASIHVASLSLT